MIDFRSNDKRVELVMDKFFMVMQESALDDINDVDHVTFSVVTANKEWVVFVCVKRPYTFVSVTHDGMIAYAFGKMNWSDTFSVWDGFEIVTRKALAEYYRGRCMTVSDAQEAGSDTQARHGNAMEGDYLITECGDSFKILNIMHGEDGLVYYKTKNDRLINPKEASGMVLVYG